LITVEKVHLHMVKSVQVRVEHLVGYYTCLGQALLEGGLTGQQLNDLFSKHVVAECTRCHIRVLGDEVGLIAVTDENSSLLHPKLQRLRCGCCARDGCESASYFLHLQNCYDVAWETTVAKAFQLLTAKEIREREERGWLVAHERRQRVKRVCVGLVVLTGLFLVGFFWRHRRLPLVSQPVKYQVDASFAGGLR